MTEFDRALGEAETAPSIDPKTTVVMADPIAEDAIAAGVLFLRDATSEVDGLCQPDDFHSRARGEVVRAALWLHRSGETIDETTVVGVLTRRRMLTKVGGVEFLRGLRAHVPQFEALRTHARSVAELALARRLIETARLVIADGLASTEAPRDFVERSVERIGHVAESRAAARVTYVGEVLDRLDADWKRNRDEGLQPGGMPTGFDGLDAITRGMRLGSVSFVGALTGRGKSVFAMQVANYLAGRKYNGRRAGVVYVSGEMDDKALTVRAICSRARVSERDIERVMSNAPDIPGEGAVDRPFVWDAVQKARTEMAPLPLAFYAHVASINDIRAAIRDATRGWRDRAETEEEAADPLLVVVDYVQMMRVGKSSERHDLALGEFMYELKDLADRQQFHALCCAQMNKAIRERAGGGAAQAEDMKNASALAESASTVVYLHRPAYDLQKRSERRRVMWPYSEIQVTKGRGHALGEVPMVFEGKHYHFRPFRDGELDELRALAADASPKAGSEGRPRDPNERRHAPGHEPGAQHWTD